MRLYFAIALLTLTPPLTFSHAIEVADSADSKESNQVAEGNESTLTFQPHFFSDANPATVIDMIERLPGFQLDEGDNLRGYGTSVGNVLLNGARPVSKRETLSSVLGRIPAGRVERIELIRSGARGIEMGGHEVVANVVLSDATFSDHSLTADANLFRGGPHLYGGRYDFTTLRDGQEYHFQLGRDFTYTDSSGTGRSVQLDAAGNILSDEVMRTGFDADAWHARGGWTGSVGPGLMELSAGIEDDEFEYRERIGQDDDQRRIDSGTDTRAADLALRYDQVLSQSTRLEGRLLQNLSWSDSTDVSDANGHHQLFESDRDQGETIARGLFRWSKSERISAEAGVELVYNFLDTEQRYTLDGEPVELPLATTRVEERRGEALTKVLWNTSDSLQFELGARLEYSTIDQSGDARASRSFLYPKPRLVMTWQATDKHQLRARIEREVGQLNFEDFAASSTLSDGEVHGGNIDLRPQRRWIAELTHEYRFSDEGVVSVTLRHDRIQDAIDVIPLDDGLTAIGNIGDGTLSRAAVNLQLPLDRIGLDGALVSVQGRYDRTRVTDPTTGERRDLSGVRPYDGSVRFRHDVPGTELTWGVTWLPKYRQPSFQPDQRHYIELRDFYILFGEYQLGDDLHFRAQLTLWDDFEMGRDVYDDRQSRELAFAERQYIDPRDILKLTLRKSF